MKYGEIYSSRWTTTMWDWTDDEKLVGVYLQSSKHANGEGLSDIPPAYVAHDLRWETARVEAAYEALCARGWLTVEGTWVLVVDALEHKQPKTEAHRKGAANRLDGVPVDSAIYRRFAQLVAKHAPGLSEYLPGAIRVALGCHSDGACEALESSSPSSSPTSTSSPPAPRADAHEGEGGPAKDASDASRTWSEVVRPELEQIPEWAADIERTGDDTFVAVVRSGPDVPWQRVAARAVAQRLLPPDQPAHLRTNSAMRALELKVADHHRDEAGAGASMDRDATARATEMDRGAKRRAAKFDDVVVVDPLEGTL